MIDIPRLRKVAADTDAYTQCRAIPTQDMDAQQLQLTADYWKRQWETRNALPELLDEIEALRKQIAEPVRKFKLPERYGHPETGSFYDVEDVHEALKAAGIEVSS